MARHMYGVTNAKCTYTPPPNHDINVYLSQLDTIMKSFKHAGRKDLTISRLDALNKLLAAVIHLKNPTSP